MNDPREAVARVLCSQWNDPAAMWEKYLDDADGVLEALSLQPAWGVDIAGTVLSTNDQAEADAVMSKPTMKRWVTPWVEQPK